MYIYGAHNKGRCMAFSLCEGKLTSQSPKLVGGVIEGGFICPCVYKYSIICQINEIFSKGKKLETV